MDSFDRQQDQDQRRLETKRRYGGLRWGGGGGWGGWEGEGRRGREEEGRNRLKQADRGDTQRIYSRELSS